MQLSIKHYFFLFFLFSLTSVDAQEMNFPFQGSLSDAFLQNETLTMDNDFLSSETNPFGETAFSQNFFFMLPNNGLLTNVFSNDPNKNYWDSGTGGGGDRNLGDPISGIPIKNGFLIFFVCVLIYFLFMKKDAFLRKVGIIAVLLFSICFETYAQCNIFTDNTWYFGTAGGGIHFVDNGSGTKVPTDASGFSLVRSGENSIVVSAPGCGNDVIFYGQHNMLYNREHKPMVNGAIQGNSSCANGLAACFIGNNKYALFSVTSAYSDPDNTRQLKYYIIDMSLDGGLGAISGSGTIETGGMSEVIKLVSVPGSQYEYWLIYDHLTTNQIRCRKVTGTSGSVTIASSYTSLNMAPHNDVAGNMPRASYGITANASRSQIAIAYLGGCICVLNFNNTTGALSHSRTIGTASNRYPQAYDVQFSPNGAYLFFTVYTTNPNIYRCVLNTGAVSAGVPFGGASGGGLKTGPDGKIYVLQYYNNTIGVITDPNKTTFTASDYRQNALTLNMPATGIVNGLKFSIGITPPAVCPTGSNLAPVAVDDQVSISKGQDFVCILPLTNDTDPNGDALRITDVSFSNAADVAKLEFTFNPTTNTVCVKTKSAAQAGDIITLNYIIKDNGGNPVDLCDEGLITVKIVNIIDDYAVTWIGNAIEIDVLDNDSSPCNISDLTLGTSVAETSKGYITIGANKKLTYTPKVGATGLDNFSYNIYCNGNPVAAGTANVRVYILENFFRDCKENHISNPMLNIQVNDVANDVLVNWFYHGTTTNANSINTSSIYGSQILSLNATVRFHNSATPVIVTGTGAIPFTIDLVPELLYWNKNATDNNWNNPSNWLRSDGLTPANSVPLKCTNVHIPGQATNYPNLNPTSSVTTYYYKETPECNDITYRFGGETAKPNLLDYKRAFIQYNVGYYNVVGGNATGGILEGDSYSPATRMNRDQWYALAAPLNKMVTGDFSFGGMPSTWQKGFITAKKESGTVLGQWHEPSNNNITELNETQSYAIAYQVAGIGPDDVVGEGKEYHNGLFQTKGIIEIPYYENSALSTAHRIHKYDPPTSTFYYYYYQNAGAPIEYNKKDEYMRNGSAYRFIFDGRIDANSGNPRFKVTVPTGREIMIGNPFLSSLDFRLFYEANMGGIMGSYYRLYENGLWDEYDYYSGGASLTNLIAPFQAFFIYIPAKASPTIDLYFPFAASVLRTDVTPSEAHQLRSSDETTENILYLTASSKDQTNSIVLDLRENERENVYKLFYEYSPNKPQIYFTDKSGQKNAIQYSDTQNKTEISLGISMASGNTVDLSFSNIENINNESLYLVDKKTGIRQDLFKNPNYRFIHNDDKTYTDRFVMEVGAYNATYIDHIQTNENSVNVYQTNESITISSKEKIEKIELFDMKGQKIQQVDEVNNNIYQMNTNLSTGIYLIKTILTNGESQTDKIVIR